jgi:hypothetical protein
MAIKTCTEPGCGKRSQGSKSDNGDSNKCVRHGGGRRCTELGCGKGALHSKYGNGDSTKCVRHGGGDPCTVFGCGKSAQSSKYGNGDSTKCVRHGGGDPCTEPGCGKSAVHSKYGNGDSTKCIRHGGGDPCTEPGCGKSAQSSKSITGDSTKCVRHGGSDRCEMPCCTSIYGVRADVATGYHPDTKKGMCTFAMRQMVSNCDNHEEQKRLMLQFGFKKLLVMRGEHAFYHALNLLVPELRESERFLDSSLLSNGLGKRKNRNDKRPDYYHYFSDGQEKTAFALHGEYDETPNHEDDDDRVAAFAEISKCIGRTYMFRVQAHHYTEQALCIPKTNKEHTYWTLTPAGVEKALQVAEVIQERLTWIKQRLEPSSERPWKTWL